MRNLLIKHRAIAIMSVVALSAFVGYLGYIKASDPVKLDVKAFSNSVEASWTTPKEAVKQELRFSTSPITPTNFESATSINEMPELVAGEKQVVKVANLKENVTYYFAYKYYIVDQARTEEVRATKTFAGKKAKTEIAQEVNAFEAAAVLGSQQAVKVDEIDEVIEAKDDKKADERAVPMVTNQADLEFKTGYAFAVTTTNDVDVVAPSTVKDMSFSSTANSITVSWTAPVDKDLDGYIIKYNTTEITKTTFENDGFVSNPPVGIPGERQQVTVSGLTPAKIYYFAVATKDFSGNISDIVTVQTGTQGVVILKTQASANAVTLMWDTPTSVVSHEMRYSTSEITDANYDRANIVNNMPAVLAGQTQMVIANQLTPVTDYYFAYKYRESFNGGVSMVTTKVRTLGHDIVGPNPVTNLNLVPQQNNIFLSWKSPSNTDLAGFHVRYATYALDAANFHTATVVNNTPIGQPNTVQSMVITKLQNNTKYWIGIMAVDASGNESQLVVSSTTTGTFVGGVNLVAFPSVNSITLQWVNPQDIISHELRYSDKPIDRDNFRFAQLVSGVNDPQPTNSQIVTVNQLTPNTKYYFAYRGVVAGGSVIYSFTSATTLVNDTTAPNPVRVFFLSPTNNTISLYWTSPSDPDLAGFHVRYATFELKESNFHTGTAVNNTPIGIPNADQSMVISGLSSDTKYWVGIMAVDAAGNESILTVANTKTTSGGGGGGGGSSSGGGSGGAVIYGAFIGPYTLKINDGNIQSFSRNVTLNIDCGGNVKGMAVSNLADLGGAQIVDYKTTYPWTVTEGVGTKTVYARCYGFEGQQSPIISDSIELVKGDGNYIEEPYTGTLPTPPTNPNNGQVLGVKLKPDNTLVRTPDLKVFLISNGGKKSRIVSVFDLYYKFKGQPIENITFEELAQYPDLNAKVLGTKVFPNGTLVRAEDYRVYVIENGYKRYLPTLEDIRAFKGKKIQNVTYTDLAQYETYSVDTTRHNNLKVGEGSLVRDSKGNIFVIRNGQRHYIPGYAEVFERYANVPVVSVNDDVLNRFPLNGPYPHTGKAWIGLGIYSNGTLIRTPDKKIYVVLDGYGEVVSAEELKTKHAGKKIINVNEYFAIPSPKPLY